VSASQVLMLRPAAVRNVSDCGLNCNATINGQSQHKTRSVNISSSSSVLPAQTRWPLRLPRDT
jgi:hypothetical protein